MGKDGTERYCIALYSIVVGYGLWYINNVKKHILGFTSVRQRRTTCLSNARVRLEADLKEFSF